jgi:plasmid stabilization system protein ParE
MEHAKHFLFYRTQSGGILVSRILHERMLPERQDFEDEDSHETQ